MKLPIIFGIHCHQPAENFYHVVDGAVKSSYGPFLEVALQSKHFRFAAHYSGWLLEYIRLHHIDVFKNLKKLSDNGQIEFFTGGYYEPILTAIPSDDRRGQVVMLSNYIKNHFGQSPEGLWLTERVWDPAVVPDMVEIGIKHIIIDDYHLIAAGFTKGNITGYYKTEQDGCSVNLFPIDMGLRYLTPFKEETEVINYIHTAKERGAKLLTCFDDGEKFGVWPKTYDWVYTKGWMKRFLDAIGNDPILEFIHYKEAASRLKPAGQAYLPITSYAEMGEWSLFADRYERFEEMKKYLNESEFRNDTEQFLKGSIWKNFLVKYPESNRLHKRTLDLSLRGRPFKSDDLFRDALYRSQCNDSLWHGVFGGLYLPNLRVNAWKPLIEAEKRFEELAKIGLPSTEIRDVDCDGFDEVYTRNKRFNALFVTRDGGQLTALELKKECFNLLNTISRKREGYHMEYMKEKDDTGTHEGGSTSIHDQEKSMPQEMKQHIVYDWYNKNSFIEHFTDKFNLEEFRTCSFRELGDFVNQCSDVISDSEKVVFSRNGGLYTDTGKTPCNIVKTYNVTEKGIAFQIDIKTAKPVDCDFVSEYNLHFADYKKVSINGSLMKESDSLKGRKFVISDPYLEMNISFEFDKEVDFSYFVIYTVSQSESGVDLTAQGVTFLASSHFNGRSTFSGKMTL